MFRLKCVAASIAGIISVVLVRRINHFTADLLIKVLLGVFIYFDHDGVRSAQISFIPKVTVRNTAINLRQRDHLLPIA